MAVSTDGSPGDAGGEQGTALKRAISGKLLYLFILGDVLGAGIYALVGKMAGQAGGAIWLPLAVPSLLALLTAASYAELVTKYPRAGGPRCSRAGPTAATWCRSSSASACWPRADQRRRVGAGVQRRVPHLVPRRARRARRAGVPRAVAALNLRGISESLGANVVMTVIELSGLLIVIVLGAVVVGRGDGDLGRVMQLPEGVSPVPAVLGAALLAFYSFVGFETSANVAEETVDPARNYPRALFGGLLTAGVVYVLVGLAVSAAVPTEQLSARPVRCWRSCGSPTSACPAGRSA